MKTRAGKNDDGVFTRFFVQNNCSAAGGMIE